MDTSKPATTSANQNKSYEEFEPPLEWVKDEASDTLLVFLPGFQKERLKIQITSAGKLRISGERPIGQNKWRRFSKEFELDPSCDTSKISAKFEGGILYVKLPKPTTITATQPPRRTPTPAPTPTPTPTPAPASSSPAHDQKRQQLPNAIPTPPTPTPILKQQADHAKANKDQKQHIVNNAEAEADRRRKELLDDTKHVTTKTTPDKKAAAAPGDQKKIMPTTAAAPSDDQKKKKMMPSRAAEEKSEKKLDRDDYDNKKGKEKASDDIADKATGKSGEGLDKKGRIMEQVKKISARTLVNSALAVLFVGVLALYVRNIFIRAFGGVENKSSSEL